MDELPADKFRQAEVRFATIKLFDQERVLAASLFFDELHIGVGTDTRTALEDLFARIGMTKVEYAQKASWHQVAKPGTMPRDLDKKKRNAPDD